MTDRGRKVRERPILMSGPMVRALLEGRKTQTRRVVRFPAHVAKDGAVAMRWHEQPEAWQLAGRYGGQQLICNRTDGDVGVWAIESPYGEPGDRLWVRETWHPGQWEVDDGPEVSTRLAFAADFRGESMRRWKPSIHMPRWASRLTLEITDVRVQRLSCLTQGDVTAEGVQDREEYARLWDHLNAKRGFPWSSDPWVWVLGFRRVLNCDQSPD